MRVLFVTTALAAAFAFTPAWAQVTTAPPVQPGAADQAPSTTQGELKIQGIEPSRVLGAIDTQKLVNPPAAERQADAAAKVAAEPPVAPTKNPDPNDKTGSDVQSASTGAVGVQTAELPTEVTAAIADGKYTTKDLVQAELEAAKNKPPPRMEVQGSATPSTSEGSPVFDRGAGPADWSQSATTDDSDRHAEPTVAAPPG